MRGAAEGCEAEQGTTVLVCPRRPGRGDPGRGDPGRVDPGRVDPGRVDPASLQRTQDL